MLQRCIIVQWPVWARTSDSHWNLLDCSKQVNFAKIFCGAKRSRRCMNTRSAFKYTYLLTWLYNQLQPMKIITLCSIGFFENFVWGKVSGRDVFEYMFTTITVLNCSSYKHWVINSLPFNKRIIRILFTEWSQSDKMLFITELTKNNSSAHLNNFCFLLTTRRDCSVFSFILLDQIFTHTCRIAVTWSSFGKGRGLNIFD